MKKILILLTTVISLSSKGQIDTVYFRNLTLTWNEWKWLIGGWNVTDSVELNEFRKVDAVIDAVSNITSSTNITVDSLKGSTVLLFYSMGQGATRGEARTLPNNGNNYRTTIRAYTPMVIYCDIIDNSWDAATESRQKRGKFKIGKST